MRSSSPENNQNQFLMNNLAEMLDPRQSLYQLALKIDWSEFEESFGEHYAHKGRPAKPIRLMVGLLILKQLYDLSDQEVVSQWTQNPYFQFFSGEQEFQWQLPCDPSELTHFRKRIGSLGAQKILEVSVGIHDKQAAEKEVIADTTVQEKNITFPTDSKLSKKIIEKCIKIACDQGISLRRSYKRTVPKLIKAQYNSKHPRRAKAARKAQRSLKTIAAKLVRELRRKLGAEALESYEQQLRLFEKVLSQNKHDKNKIYSLHEPEVSCISKGKEHKKYEFGQKASIIKTKNSGVIVGAMSFANNPYDGHTLEAALKQVEAIVEQRPEICLVDKGYRGCKQVDGTEVLMPSAGNKNQTAYQKQKARKRFRKRAGIEPVIGHLKSDFKLKRNYLKGLVGDEINIMLSAAAFNFAKWLRERPFCLRLLHAISHMPQEIRLYFATRIAPLPQSHTSSIQYT